MWIEAFERKYKGSKECSRQDWDQLLGHVEAITDFPVAVFQDGVGVARSRRVVVSTYSVEDHYVLGIQARWQPCWAGILR